MELSLCIVVDVADKLLMCSVHALYVLMMGVCTIEITGFPD
jgi:hypothetical protein